MKYPLKWHHIFAREMTCYLFGHKWKFAPRRETQYHGMMEDEVPYDFRKRTGNYMYENITWWKGKCVRCRYHTRDNNPWRVWHQELRDGIRHGIQTANWTLEYLFTEASTPLWKRILYSPMLVFTQFWFQFCAAHERWPWSLWTWSADLEYWIYVQLEKDCRE